MNRPVRPAVRTSAFRAENVSSTLTRATGPGSSKVEQSPRKRPDVVRFHDGAALPPCPRCWRSFRYELEIQLHQCSMPQLVEPFANDGFWRPSGRSAAVAHRAWDPGVVSSTLTAQTTPKRPGRRPGYRHSPETRMKITAAALRRGPHTEETIEKIRRACARRLPDPVEKERQRQGMLAYWARRRAGVIRAATG